MKICQKETDELNMHGKLKGNYYNLCLYYMCLLFRQISNHWHCCSEPTFERDRAPQ
jgi:hypothetical protein